MNKTNHAVGSQDGSFPCVGGAVLRKGHEKGFWALAMFCVLISCCLYV